VCHTVRFASARFVFMLVKKTCSFVFAVLVCSFLAAFLGVGVTTADAYVTTFVPLEGISKEKTQMHSSGFVAGGWSDASPTDQDVVDAAAWCVTNQYPSGGVDGRVVSARKQIVAGTKYALNVAVTAQASSTCSMRTYVVVKKLLLGGVMPDPPYVLLESDELDTACPAADGR